MNDNKIENAKDYKYSIKIDLGQIIEFPASNMEFW